MPSVPRLARKPRGTRGHESLAEVFGQPAEIVGMGGTIPIVTTFRDVLGADSVFFSFSTADENIHAPDAFYRPERFRLGLQAWARVWRRLSQALQSLPVR